VSIVYCDHGDKSVAPFECARAEAPDACPVCPTIKSSGGLYFAVEAMEEIGMNRHDNTRGINMGLAGKFVSLGRDPKTGKEHFDYRPTTSAEANSVWNAHEPAQSQGLTPIDRGHFPTVCRGTYRTGALTPTSTPL